MFIFLWRSLSASNPFATQILMVFCSGLHTSPFRSSTKKNYKVLHSTLPLTLTWQDTKDTFPKKCCLKFPSNSEPEIWAGKLYHWNLFSIKWPICIAKVIIPVVWLFNVCVMTKNYAFLYCWTVCVTYPCEKYRASFRFAPDLFTSSQYGNQCVYVNSCYYMTGLKTEEVSLHCIFWIKKKKYFAWDCNKLT
jgi:hypothetical protein